MKRALVSSLFQGLSIFELSQCHWLLDGGGRNFVASCLLHKLILVRLVHLSAFDLVYHHYSRCVMLVTMLTRVGVLLVYTLKGLYSVIVWR